MEGMTKKQHYVPRFYLRHFSGDRGSLCAYRRPENRYFKTKPEDICNERFLYESRIGEGDNFFRTNHIEHKLSEKESDFSKYQDVLLKCCREQDFTSKSFEEGRLSICDFVANLISRNPYFLKKDRALATDVAEDLARSEQLAETDWMLLNCIGLEGGLEPLADAAIMNFTLLSGDLKAPAAQIKETLAMKRMNILQASSDMPFVSCSMPITFIDINDDCSDFDIALLPLSSRYAALFDRKQSDGELELLTTEMTVQFNATILASNEIWLTAFGCNEEALRAAVDLIEKYRQMQR